MTVLLDTNVVSELMCKAPDPAVAVWAAGHPLEDLLFSAVGEAELRYGAAILPTGRRRETLVSDIERMLDEAFENRVLPFDSGAARAYADIAAMRRSAGRPVGPADCQIAAIAPPATWRWRRAMFRTSRTWTSRSSILWTAAGS